MSDNWNTLRSQIEYFSKPFPRAAMEFAQAHRDEVAPYLVDALVQMAADPSRADDDDYVLHLYAMHLLAQWRDPRAYEPLVAMGHHSDDTLDMILGDTVTESYGRCLASVCDGNLQPLYALFEDTQASHWARNAALDALMVRVFEGDGARDELVHYLMVQGDAEFLRLGLLDAQSGDLEVLDCIASVVVDMAVVEMTERLDVWFDAHLLDESIMDKKWAHEHMALSFEACRDRQLGGGRGYVHEVEKEIGWWSGFRDAKPKSTTPQSIFQPFLQPISKPAPIPQPVRTGAKIGRNDPCPCGSGKKYKKCHG